LAKPVYEKYAAESDKLYGLNYKGNADSVLPVNARFMKTA